MSHSFFKYLACQKLLNYILFFWFHVHFFHTLSKDFIVTFISSSSHQINLEDFDLHHFLPHKSWQILLTIIVLTIYNKHMKVKLESMKIKLLLLRILILWCKLDEFKEGVAWNLYNHNLSMQVFYKVNNIQHVDLTQNQMMWCIIHHNELGSLEILVLHIRCHHWLPQVK